MPPPPDLTTLERERLVRSAREFAVRSIQEEEDAYILQAMENAANWAVRPTADSLERDLETLRAWARRVEASNLRAERLLMSPQDWDDITRWAHPPDIRSGGEIIIRAGTGTGVGGGGALTITGGNGAGSGAGGVTITGGTARRVTIPEFELFSSPSIRLDDVRQRRFSLIDVSFNPLEPSVSRILEAVVRAKAPPPEAPRPREVYTNARTIWEVLVEPDLVDADAP